MRKRFVHLCFYFVLLVILYPVYKVLFKTKVKNGEKVNAKGPLILAGNHVSTFDVLHVVFNVKRPVIFLVKELVFEYNIILKMMMRMAGFIEVYANRKNPQAINSSVNWLNSNHVIGIFPEGKIKTSDDVLEQFRYGAVKMAKLSGCLIVPFSLTGDMGFLSRNVRLSFGEPIDVADMEIDEANTVLFNSVKQLVEENS